MSLRETAKADVLEEVRQAERYSHQKNYHRLHVWRDGSVSWFESINKSDDLIDPHAKSLKPIASVHVTGTGSYACNCDWCNEVYHPDAEKLAHEQGREYDRATKYDTHEDAIEDAAWSSDLSDLEMDILASFRSIPAGYFDDETESEQELAEETQNAY